MYYIWELLLKKSLGGGWLGKARGGFKLSIIRLHVSIYITLIAIESFAVVNFFHEWACCYANKRPSD